VNLKPNDYSKTEKHVRRVRVSSFSIQTNYIYCLVFVMLLDAIILHCEIPISRFVRQQWIRSLNWSTT